MKVPKAKNLPSGNWFIHLRLGGENIPITAKTEKACTKQAQVIKAEYLAGRREKLPTLDDITLTQCIDKYIQRRAQLSPATLRGYKIIQKNYFQAYMEKPIRSIKNWQEVYDSEKQRLSPYTLKNAFGFLRSVYKETMRREMPVVDMLPPTRSERPFLDKEEIRQFLAAIEGRNCEIGALLALHSLRVSETLDLTWEDVDLKRKRLRVHGAVVPDADNKWVRKDTNKNDTSRRYVPIFIPRLEELLAEHYGDDRPVCRYTTEAGLYKAINNACESAGLPKVGNHGLRHSFASLVVLLHLPEPVLQAVGGWKDSATVHKIYTHISQRDLEEQLADVQAWFEDQPDTNANENANRGVQPLKINDLAASS